MSPNEEYDIFISYVSEDREQVLSICKVFEGIGVNVWIDRYRIPGGANFGEEIPKAIKASKVLMPMCSASFFSNYKNVQAEVELAWKYNREIVPLRLEDVPVSEKFEYWLSTKQYIDIFQRNEKEWVRDLIRALQRFGIETAENKHDEQRPTTGSQESVARRALNPGNNLLPYLVDRKLQHDQLEIALTDHVDKHSRRPLFLFVHGDTEQAVDMFIERVAHFDLPKILQRYNIRNDIDWFRFEWPIDTGTQNPTSSEMIHNRKRRLRLALTQELELRSTVSDSEIRGAIINRRAPVLLSTLFGAEAWEAYDIDLMKEWLREWANFPDLPSTQPLIIVIAIHYAKKSSWFIGKLFSGRKKSSVNSSLKTLSHTSINKIQKELIKELENVDLDAAKLWVQDLVRPKDIGGMLKDIRVHYHQVRRAISQGIPMVPLAEDCLKELVKTYLK